ncbi:hypothetical protein SAMN05421688_0362 [Poseidonocella pacifica]|uniref:NADH dehydrogenase subunit E n=1 Tax=Poseidonocella pacifica TaxID=871651 RepID=A0A1I0V7T9_9RHOB|nr:DUF5333 domain-containing protein [Poseidonocella pacifica]SFA72133.1 hypothetical protein SAMN05421688_0362 [Poseidonocella pacifica]
MRLLKSVFVGAALAGVLATGVAAAKPPLSEVTKINQGLLVVGIADEIRKECNVIEPRMFTALGYINTLVNEAQALGYSRDEIEEFRKSKAVKKKLRADGEAYISAKGYDPKSANSLCDLGRAEIAAGSPIGKLLRAR